MFRDTYTTKIISRLYVFLIRTIPILAPDCMRVGAGLSEKWHRLRVAHFSIRCGRNTEHTKIFSKKCFVFSQAQSAQHTGTHRGHTAYIHIVFKIFCILHIVYTHITLYIVIENTQNTQNIVFIYTNSIKISSQQIFKIGVLETSHI